MANRKAYRRTFNDGFRKECTVISLGAEYPGLTGTEKYLILTDLSEEKAREKYKEELSELEPCVIWKKEMLEIMNDYNRNEEKYGMRAMREEERRKEDFFSGRPFQEPAVEGIEEEIVYRLVEEEREPARDAALTRAILRLTEKQKRRLWLRIWFGFTYEQISKIEGIGKMNAERSIKRALIRLKNSIEEETGVLPAGKSQTGDAASQPENHSI